MKFLPRARPRRFSVGSVTISDIGSIELGADEQLTFVTASGTEFDVARKAWGYYATPSLNGRLPAHGLRPVLVTNAQGRIALLLVERGHEDEFHRYLASEDMRVLSWIDTDDEAERLIRLLGAS